MDIVAKDANGILWYDLRTKYDHDPRIYSSQCTSIIENFKFRLFSQDRRDPDFPFPIKLIRSIFTNAEKIGDRYSLEGHAPRLSNVFSTLRAKLENAIDTCVGRIQIHVFEPYSNDGNGDKNIWAYPVECVKSIGFKPANDEIYIKLFRAEDNVRQVCAHNAVAGSWEKLRDIKFLRQLHIHHAPSMKEILRHTMPDLAAIREICDMNFAIPDLSVKDYGRHLKLWERLFPLLEELLRETGMILAQYQLTVVPHYLHSRKTAN